MLTTLWMVLEREWWPPHPFVLLHMTPPTLKAKMWLKHEPPVGHVQPWASPSSLLLENKQVAGSLQVLCHHNGGDP